MVNHSSSLCAVILAAGKGVRMHSRLPKVLHPLAGKPILSHLLDTVAPLVPAIAIIEGYEGEKLRAHFEGKPYHFIHQENQLGTGHALKEATAFFEHSEHVLVLLGDTPLVSSELLSTLLQDREKNTFRLVTVDMPDPTGLGRIIRDKNHHIIQIVEDKDASAAQKAITEISTGIMLLPVKPLLGWLKKLQNHNAQGEYYLTDVIAMAISDGYTVEGIKAPYPQMAQGINTKMQLATLERFYQAQEAKRLMEAGVQLADPARLDCRGKITVGMDVSIDIDVILEGEVILGDRVSIGPFVHLKNCRIENDSVIESHTVIDSSHIGAHCKIGPFARLRPETVLDDHVKVGDFVEIKKSTIGEGSKVPHLSYIGDATLGKNVNIGAGTITCNYDGKQKSQTIIKDGAFIGSDSQLVAPVTIGEGAYIGAGSTITKDAPAEELTISRAKQTTITGWKKKHS
jgi:bifunctional UDP-N-acetylglucosamine pyrophosphorylase/glucosamine-1-phosphate N-acetyltransferase